MLVAGRSKMLWVRKSFEGCSFRVAICCFYAFSTYLYLLYMHKFSFFWSELQRFPYMGGVTFFGDLVQVIILFCFSVFVSEYFLPTICRFIRELCPTYVIFSNTLSGDDNFLELISQTVCHHNRGPCFTWNIFTNTLFYPFNWFLEAYSRFLRWRKLIDSSSCDWFFFLWLFFLFIVFPYMIWSKK